MCLVRKLVKNQTALPVRFLSVLWLESPLGMPTEVQVAVLSPSQVRRKLARVRHCLSFDKRALEAVGRAGSWVPSVRPGSQRRNTLGRGRYSMPAGARFPVDQSVAERTTVRCRRWCFRQAPEVYANSVKARSAVSSSLTLPSPKNDFTKRLRGKCRLTVMFKYPLSSNLL